MRSWQLGHGKLTLGKCTVEIIYNSRYILTKCNQISNIIQQIGHRGMPIFTKNINYKIQLRKWNRWNNIYFEWIIAKVRALNTINFVHWPTYITIPLAQYHLPPVSWARQQYNYARAIEIEIGGSTYEIPKYWLFIVRFSWK